MRVNAGIFLENNAAQLTREFKPILYLGNPRNAIEIFSAMDYDELCVFSSKVDLDETQIEYLRWIANGSKSPIMYSGGVKSLHDAKEIIENGYEKICLQSQFIKTPELATEIAHCVGKQSNILLLDCHYDALKNIWMLKNSIELDDFLIKYSNIISDSFGELLINSITHNGKFNMSSHALLALKKCTSSLMGLNIGYCGGVANVDDIQVLKSLDFDACYIFSAATLSSDRNSKLLNSHVLGNLR